MVHLYDLSSECCCRWEWKRSAFEIIYVLLSSVNCLFELWNGRFDENYWNLCPDAVISLVIFCYGECNESLSLS